MIQPAPTTPWGRFTRSEVFDGLAALMLGIVFYALQGDPADGMLAPWQVGAMAAGAFLMLGGPIQVAALRRAAPETTRIDRLHYPFLLGVFWGSLMLLGAVDEGWPEARVDLMVWTGAAALFAVLITVFDRPKPGDRREDLRARFLWDETASAASRRLRWQIGQAVAVAAILCLAATWPAMWERPAYPVLLIVLAAYAGPPVRHAEDNPRAGLRRAMSFLGVLTFIGAYALG
jgi:hypothetical protein